MKNQGISLISLIITIIVIIILAAIVIFTGLGTPDSAQFSNFCQQVDNVYMAVTDEFADLKVAHAISGDYRTNEQIYFEVATGIDATQYGGMNGETLSLNAGTNSIKSGDVCQRIDPAKSLENIGMKLPKVRQTDAAWYVTEDGRVFNATGYVYDTKTYFNASIYTPGELSVTESATLGTRATSIAKALMSGDTSVNVD